MKKMVLMSCAMILVVTVSSFAEMGGMMGGQKGESGGMGWWSIEA